MSDEMMLFAKTEESDLALADAQDSTTEKYLIFLSHGIFYGVNADMVKEIITEISITHLPRLPQHVSGVINLRGQIVPIVDFRLLLGQEPGEESCTVILNIDNMAIGILADSVDRITDIEKETIVPVPYQTPHDARKFVSGMCSIPNENATMMVIDVSLLLHEQ